MLSYPIQAAKQSGLFEEVVVSTEDAEIAEIARSFGATVHDRPAELATDTVGETAACQHYLQGRVEHRELPPAFCCIYATAAFILPGDLRAAAEILEGETRPDAVMGVSIYPIHPYKALILSEGYLAPLWPEQNAKRSQEFPETVASNGTFYWVRTEPFLRKPTFYQEKLAGYVLPPDRAVDIDTPEDLERARRLADLANPDGREGHV